MWALLGLVVALTCALWALLACTCFSRPRRLCVLLCTHPDPTLGPLYVPDEVRHEYAMQLGLKQVPVGVWSFLLGRRGAPPTQLSPNPDHAQERCRARVDWPRYVSQLWLEPPANWDT